MLLQHCPVYHIINKTYNCKDVYYLVKDLYIRHFHHPLFSFVYPILEIDNSGVLICPFSCSYSSTYSRIILSSCLLTGLSSFSAIAFTLLIKFSSMRKEYALFLYFPINVLCRYLLDIYYNICYFTISRCLLISIDVLFIISCRFPLISKPAGVIIIIFHHNRIYIKLQDWRLCGMQKTMSR